MDRQSYGRVKWIAEDGTGYIEAGGVTFYSDRMCMVDGPVSGGDNVRFTPQLFLGKWYAYDVTTKGMLQAKVAKPNAAERELPDTGECGECGEPYGQYGDGEDGMCPTCADAAMGDVWE